VKAGLPKFAAHLGCGLTEMMTYSSRTILK
jgi:hypothetical protein